MHFQPSNAHWFYINYVISGIGIGLVSVSVVSVSVALAVSFSSF